MTETITRREALRRVGVVMGGALAAPTVAGILGGCRPNAECQPVLLTGRRGDITSVVVDRIIPATNTPGARDVGVPRYIDRMLAEWYPEALRQRFLDGLDDLDERARMAGAGSFLSADAAQQREILLQLDRETFDTSASQIDSAREPDSRTDAGQEPDRPTDSVRERTEGGTTLEQPLDLTPETHNKLQRAIDEAAKRTAARRPSGGPVTRADTANEGSLIADPSFWRIIKELTLLGYYWSEAGATQELTFVQVPGRWEACVPLTDIGTTWAT